MKTGIHTLAAISMSLFTGLLAHGATYNFYFNNTEQGDNSTATPQVVVSDEKLQKAGEQPSPASETKPEPSPTPPPAPTAAEKSENAVAAASPSEEKKYYFRFTGGVYRMDSHKAADPFWSRPEDPNYKPPRWARAEDKQTAGFILGVSGMNKYFGGTVLLGSRNGLELEANPIHLGGFSLGAMVGWTTGAFGNSFFEEHGAHLGTRMNMFFQNWGGYAAFRMTPIQSADFTYKLFEAGIAVRI